METSDGFQYAPFSGLKSGLRTKACISPALRGADEQKVFDVIVVGAGYAGLIACRELVTRGHSTLLIEARDRVGGRTWTADVDGVSFEMGGTWMHWFQAHVYREISKYGLIDELVSKSAVDDTHAYTTLRREDGDVKLALKEEIQVRDKALTTFFDIDGERGRIVMPTPHRSLANIEAFRGLDDLSVEARLAQVAEKLSATEMAYLRATLVNCCCGMDLARMAFFDILRWWALSGYTADGIDTCAFTYKLRRGQTSLARALFDDAASCASLSYAFKTPVARICTDEDLAQVETAPGAVYRAQRIICTIPWNVLRDIEFRPSLPSATAALLDDVPLGGFTKIHVEVVGSEWNAWTHLSAANKLTGGIQYLSSTGITPSGDTTMVAFSLQEGEDRELRPSDEPEKAIQALKSINDRMDVRRLVFHNWMADPYARSVAITLRTGGETESSLPRMRQTHGQIHFANTDWAHGWRGFIDGAMEQGLYASTSVHRELSKTSTTLAERLPKHTSSVL